MLCGPDALICTLLCKVTPIQSNPNGQCAPNQPCPIRLPLLVRDFRAVMEVHESVSAPVGSGSQPSTQVGRASLLAPQSGHGVNLDTRLLVPKSVAKNCWPRC